MANMVNRFAWACRLDTRQQSHSGLLTCARTRRTLQKQRREMLSDESRATWRCRTRLKAAGMISRLTDRRRSPPSTPWPRRRCRGGDDKAEGNDVSGGAGGGDGEDERYIQHWLGHVEGYYGPFGASTGRPFGWARLGYIDCDEK